MSNPYQIENHIGLEGITRIDEIKNFSHECKVVGMILGISRCRPYSMNYNAPYIFHLTDFGKCDIENISYFENRNFNRDELKGKTFDIAVFPTNFELIRKDNLDEIDLLKKVRYFKLFEDKPLYEDGWDIYEAKDVYHRLKIGKNEEEIRLRDRDYFMLENYHIWLTFEIKFKYYKGLIQFISCNKYECIPINKLQKELKNCGQIAIWNEFDRIYGNTSVFDDIFPESEEEDNQEKEYNSQFINYENNLNIKRRKVDSFNNEMISKKFKNMNYSLIKELEKDNEIEKQDIKYFPFFIIVNKIRIIDFDIDKEETFVYLYHKKLFIKRVRILVNDENNDEILIYIKEQKLCEFLGIKIEEYEYFENLNEDIKRIINERFSQENNSKDYYGMIISRDKFSNGIYKWCWEYTTKDKITI